ncbi:Cerato-platanin [Penicillium brevicompactum]|uniref:Cerato-platanin n=1 Tax=Penicillium brevicompactum TaxID=5074 RepID=A0A9W9UG19_PENBR|nr:Cerato-platanin [Penicillium brevicompactum]KAJ5325466.1 Cerato-platanin [Penicillium brevicompactum]KAJ5339768.1 Cerato-platanin [Penicillium brevicompactum]KAJ5342600.1 Cerato-platanin [Penicillium brevicompactum]
MKSVIAFTSAFLATLNLATAAPAPAVAQTVSVSFDPKFDVGTSSLNTVTCSDGPNGLVTAGFTDFASLPSFPRIGGAPTVEAWNSVNCGACYEIHYANDKFEETITVLAVDSAPGGFNIGKQAMNLLTRNQADQLGRIDATYIKVADSVCGL